MVVEVCVITYSLRDNEVNSDTYYKDVSIFTDEVLAVFEKLTGVIIEKYMLFLRETSDGNCSSKEEHGFELLTLGTLWRVYSGDASGLDEAPGQFLTRLTRLRKQRGSLKRGIDFVRGILSTIFLSPDLDDNMFILEPEQKYFEKLLIWLSAAGEFSQEVKRLCKWKGYMQALSQQEGSEILVAAISLADWFQTRSLEVLGRYTRNVENYLSEQRPGRYWREDVILCGRRRVEYHLNMVGAEVMNRAYRSAFKRTSKKVLLLPACMRRISNSKCMADNTGYGFSCVGCTRQCNVNQLTQLGKEFGFSVVTVPHESAISSSLKDRSFLDSDTGVIGVACVLNLVSGGWMLTDMGIPSQCVILDYCGCKNHWSKEGISTQININQLKKVLDNI